MRFLVPDAETLAKIDGHVLRVLTALCRSGTSGQVEIGDLRRRLRMSSARVLEALDGLEAAGGVVYSYAMGVIEYRLKRWKAVRNVDVNEHQALALMELTPSACKLWWLLTAHTGKDELAWPSLRRLTKLMNRCKRTVELAMQVLIDLGLYVKRKVLWTKVPGFKWPLSKRGPKRKKVSVFVRTRTFALNSSDSLRRVREHLKHEICLAGVEKKQSLVVVDVDALPDELRSLADLGPEQKVDHYMVGHLEHLGFSKRASAWIATRCPRENVLIGFRRLLEGVKYIKDPKRYLLACLRRLAPA